MKWVRNIWYQSQSPPPQIDSMEAKLDSLLQLLQQSESRMASEMKAIKLAVDTIKPEIAQIKATFDTWKPAMETNAGDQLLHLPDVGLVLAIDDTDPVAPTPTRCSTEGPSSDASELRSATAPTAPSATVNIIRVLAAASDGTHDGQTISGATSTPAICSTGGMVLGTGGDNPAREPSTATPTKCSTVGVDLDIEAIHVMEVHLLTDNTNECSSVSVEILGSGVVRPPWPPPQMGTLGFSSRGIFNERQMELKSGQDELQHRHNGGLYLSCKVIGSSFPMSLQFEKLQDVTGAVLEWNLWLNWQPYLFDPIEMSYCCDKMIIRMPARLGMHGLEPSSCSHGVELLMSCVHVFVPDGVNYFQDLVVYSQIAWWLYDRQPDSFGLMQLETKASAHNTCKNNQSGYARTLNCLLGISSSAIPGFTKLLVLWTEAMVRHLHCSFTIPSWFNTECAFFSVSEYYQWVSAKLYHSPIFDWEILWLCDLKYSKGGNMFRQPFSVGIFPEQYHWQNGWSSLVVMLYPAVVMRWKTAASSSHQLKLTVQWGIAWAWYLHLGGSVNCYKFKEIYRPMPKRVTMLSPAGKMASDVQPFAWQDKATITPNELAASSMIMMEAFKIGKSVLRLVHGYWSGNSGCLQWDPGGIGNAAAKLARGQDKPQDGEMFICSGHEGYFVVYSDRNEQLECSLHTSGEQVYYLISWNKVPVSYDFYLYEAYYFDRSTTTSSSTMKSTTTTPTRSGKFTLQGIPAS